MTSNNTILVLGATGPAGICFLRELLHRGHKSIAYARNLTKLPPELVQNASLEVRFDLICPHTTL